MPSVAALFVIQMLYAILCYHYDYAPFTRCHDADIAVFHVDIMPPCDAPCHDDMQMLLRHARA